MPNLDLSGAQSLRIANHDVLEVRVANQTVWTAPSTLPLPIAAYSFDAVDGNGWIVDKSGNGHSLVPVANGEDTPDLSSLLIAGHDGNALTSYDDGRAVAQEPSLPMPRVQGTIMGWFYIREILGAGSEVPLIGFFTGTGGDTMLALWQQRGWGPGRVLQGNLRKENASLYGFGQENYLLPVGEWVHVAFMFNTSPDTVQIYVNGEYITGNDNVLDGSPLNGGTAYLYVGGYGYGAHRADTDDVRIFDVALTQEQIQAYMAMPVQ